jgi:glycosyltransferase involved in cell wall biosynthesis
VVAGGFAVGLNGSLSAQPLVSIVTPVYNGEKYLAECIESVLCQTYRNWQYHIVNNCSTDKSLVIAQTYAEKDPRIRIHNNQHFLSMVENFNATLLQISPESKYCKIVHADDWLFPDCIGEMVSLADKSPAVGIVGSYVLEGVRIKCDGLPYPNPVFPGRDIARMSLMGESPAGGGLYVFGSPTSLLIRSDLIRSRNPFYRDRYYQVVDQEACYYLLQKGNFGFVYKVLTYSRLHDSSATSFSGSVNRLLLEELMLLMEYGPLYLTRTEYDRRFRQRIEIYYRFLAQSVFERRGKRFWKFHIEGLGAIGQFSWSKLIRSTACESIRKGVRGLRHPGRELRKVRESLTQGKSE